MENATDTGTEGRTQCGSSGLPELVSQVLTPGRIFTGMSEVSPAEQTIRRCGYLDEPRLTAKRRP